MGGKGGTSERASTGNKNAAERTLLEMGTIK